MITVNSILFSNSLRPSQPATNRLVGNAGDVVVATINLTTTATLNDLIFYVNCVPNNTQLYNSPLVGDLFSSVFNSLTNNANCFYTRTSGVIAPASPRSFDNSNSIVVNFLGSFVYEIVHTFVLAPILRENELDNDIFSNPSYYSNNGLKYVFRLDSINDGITLETTDDVNLETLNIIRNGSVSGWGTSLGTGAINYNLVIVPNLSNINSNQITTHTAQIKKLSGAWLITDLISYRLQAISEISGYDFTQSLLQNTKFDFVTHNVEDAPQDGANGFILDCFCEIDSIDNTLLNVTFSIAANYSNEFSVFFACSSDVVGFEHQNVLATFGTSSLQGDDTQVQFVNYAGFNGNFRIGFINWYNQTFIDEGFNHLRAYRKDDNEVFFGVRINGTPTNAAPARQTCNLSNVLLFGVTNLASLSLTDINTTFPFTISVGNVIAVQYFRNTWVTDLITVSSLIINNAQTVGFYGTPTFSAIQNSNFIGVPSNARLRNVTTSSSVIQIGSETPTSYPNDLNFPTSTTSFEQNVTFITLNCGFKDLNTNQFLQNETFSFDFNTNVPFVLDRGYIRKSDNPKKYIQVAYVGDRYQFRYGFNVGSEFLASDNIVFEVNVTFTDINGFALTNTIRSPRLELGQYDVTQNTIAEPQVLASPIGQPKFYIVDGSNTPDFGTEYDGLIAGKNMLIVSTFQDNNLNDLQANEADLAGYFAITTPNEIKEIERYFFSTYQSEPNTPFQAINGHTAGLVKVTKIDIKTATLSAIINYDRLVAAFPNTKNICIVSRLDRPQPTVNPFYKEISFHFTQPNGTQLITNPAIENFVSPKWFSDGNTSNVDFRFKINTTGATDLNDASWGLVPYLSVATFQSTPVLTGYTVRVEYIGSGTQTDILGKIEYISLIPTVSPFVGIHTRLTQTASNDFMAFYTEPLSLTEFVATNTNRFHSVRNNTILANSSNLTNFTSYDITTLNTDLASSAQPYAHFFLEPTTLANTTTTVKGNFGAANREVIEYVSGAKRLYYPTTPNGVNPPAIVNDLTDDIYEVESLDVRQFHAWNLRPVGSVLTYFATCRLKNTFDAIISQSTNGFNGVLIFNGDLYYNLESISTAQDTSKYADAVTLNNGVYTFVVEVTKGAEVGTLPNLWSVRFWINGRMCADLPFQNAPYVAGIPWQDQNLHLFSSGSYYGNQPTRAGRNAGLMNRAVTEEEVRRYAMGNEDILRTGCQHAWIFDTLNATPLNPSWRVVPNVGLLGTATNGCLVKNTTNTLGNLFT